MSRQCNREVLHKKSTLKTLKTLFFILHSIHQALKLHVRTSVRQVINLEEHLVKEIHTNKKKPTKPKPEAGILPKSLQLIDD